MRLGDDRFAVRVGMGVRGDDVLVAVLEVGLRDRRRAPPKEALVQLSLGLSLYCVR